ncbi:MAG: lipopolysaccharide transport periplasmic protein LptA, partial [Pseudomonadota bacterium]
STTDISRNTTKFRGLRITQGATRIEAEQAETTAGTDFADSTWQFSGNVRIDVGSAEIRAEQADLRFLNHELVSARVAGQPAEFRDTNALTGQVTEGAAEQFDYDVANELVRFENNARISDSVNEVKGKLLVYDVAAQQVMFEGDEETGERVRIVIQPPEDDVGSDPQQSLEDEAEQTLERLREASEDDAADDADE